MKKREDPRWNEDSLHWHSPNDDIHEVDHVQGEVGDLVEDFHEGDHVQGDVGDLDGDVHDGGDVQGDVGDLAEDVHEVEGVH